MITVWGETAKLLAVGAALLSCLTLLLLPHIIPSFYDYHPALADENATMTALVYRQPGNTSVLELDAAFSKPTLRDTDLLIQVKAVGLNPCDFKVRRNPVPAMIRPLPKIPGEDVAGIVVQKGKKCSDVFEINDRVAAMMPIIGATWGAAAEYVVINEAFVAKISEKLSFEEAAAMPLVSLTALQALNKLNLDNENDDKEKKILIHAGAGGVGTFAIQYAKKVLHMYVATTASKKKTRTLQKLGADLVIDYKTDNFEDVIEYYDAVLDPMSWLYEERTFAKREDKAPVLKHRVGHYLNVQSSDWALDSEGAEVGNGFITWKHLMYHKAFRWLLPGSTVPNYDVVGVSPNGKQLQDIMDLVEEGTIIPVVDRTFALKDAKDAFEYLEEGHATGKVVLKI